MIHIPYYEGRHLFRRNDVAHCRQNIDDNFEPSERMVFGLDAIAKIVIRFLFHAIVLDDEEGVCFEVLYVFAHSLLNHVEITSSTPFQEPLYDTRVLFEIGRMFACLLQDGLRHDIDAWCCHADNLCRDRSGIFVAHFVQ